MNLKNYLSVHRSDLAVQPPFPDLLAGLGPNGLGHSSRVSRGRRGVLLIFF